MSSPFAVHQQLRAATFPYHSTALVRALSSKTPGKRNTNVGDLAAVLASVLEREDTNIIEQVIQELLEDTNKLVKPTTRIQQFDLDDVGLFFDVDHRLTAVTSLLTKFHSFGKQTRAVVLGHKHQGKTQFLFFLTKLLQALDEGVVYLDKSIAPKVGAEEADFESDDFCLRHWQPELVTFLNQKDGGPAAVQALAQFAKVGSPGSFALFHKALRTFTRTSKARVWLIVDEAASEELESFRGYLSKEQKKDIFHSIITGSVGIASFVDERHLGKWTWDLPLFTPSAAAEFAVKALAAKEANTVDLWGDLGIKKSDDNAAAMENLGDQLHELFGGVAGYTAELVLALTKGETLSSYTLELSDRVRSIIVKASKNNSISSQALSDDWLAEIRSSMNTWSCVRDAGLCGSEAPRGVIFSLMLKWLLIFAPRMDELAVVQFFRSKFHDDPGLEGCLLELEEIIKLTRGTPFDATHLHLNDEQKWAPIGDSVELPCATKTPQLWTYDIITGTTSKGQHVEFANSHVVLLPPGFCVLDVLLVLYDDKNSTLQFYLVQITRAEDPFLKHVTNETCKEASKTKIGNLLDSVKTAVAGSKEVATPTSYVMLAPNTKGEKYVAPEQTSDYYFSPPTVLGSSAPQRHPPGLKRDLKKALNALKRNTKELEPGVTADEVSQLVFPSLKGLSKPGTRARTMLNKGLSAQDKVGVNRWLSLTDVERLRRLKCSRR